MSDWFSGLFSGGGDSTPAPTGGGGGGDFQASNFFGGGDTPFGGDLGGGLGSLASNAGNMLGMGGYDPSQANPQQVTQAGNDPGAQLAGSRPDQSNQQGGQKTGGGGQGTPSMLQILSDAISGKFQQPGFTGYTPMGGQPQQAGPAPGAVNPAAPTSSTASAGPAAPSQGPMDTADAGQPAQQPAPGTQPQYADESQKGMGTGKPSGAPPAKTDVPGVQEADPKNLIKPDDPRFGANKPTGPAGPGASTVPAALPPGQGGQAPGQGGGQPGQELQQFMKSPFGQLIGGLLQQMLGRMGPAGQMLGQLLSPMLSQLAGQAGFQGGQPGGPGQSQWNPEMPPIDRGKDWMNRAIPGGISGQENNVLQDVMRRESGGRNLAPWENGQYKKDIAMGRNPTSHASGYFQFQPGTWRRWAQASGIGTQYREAYQAPYEVQAQVAAFALRHTPGGANSSSLWGASSRGGTYASLGGGGFQPNYASARRRARDRMAMGWMY